MGMDIVTRIITAVGTIGGIGGLAWILSGAIDYFGGRKNNDGAKQDNGMQAIISGAGVFVIVPGVALAINGLLSTFSF